MAEKIIAKLRVKEIHFADPILTSAGVATAAWEEQPLTLRDDEVSIVEGDPEEDSLYSHENDSPEDVDISGTGLTVVGSFIKATRAQMVALMGGNTSGADPALKYEHPSKKLVLNKAMKFVCHDGSEVIIPNAKGSVALNMNVGKGGTAKYPFRFRALQAAPEWDCDIIL